LTRFETLNELYLIDELMK